MSIECLNKAIKVDGLTPTKKLVLILLANYADENKSCYPSYSHIAKLVGLKDTKNIKRIIDELVERGLLRKENRIKEDGGNTSNKYYITIGGGVETHRGVEETRVGVSEPPNTKDDTKTNIEEFEKFWKIYPRKVGKKTALKSFTKINDKEYEKVLLGAEIFAELNQQTEERFIPHPTTWLNQERYMDAFETDDKGCVIGIKRKNKSLNNLAG